MTATPSFFNTVATFAKPFVKNMATVSKDPLIVAKAKFAQVADDQIKLIKSTASKGFWFKQMGDGYVLNLKNGAAVLKGCSFAVGSAADAIKLLETAKVSAAAGEFDELFKATARAPRKAKEVVAPASPVVQQPAPAAPQIAPTASAKSKRK